MADVETALTTAVTPAGLWGQIEPMIPFIGTMIVFAFGYYILRKVIKGGSKGKARI